METLAEIIIKVKPMNKFKPTATRIVFWTPINGMRINPAKKDPIIVPEVLEA